MVHCMQRTPRARVLLVEDHVFVRQLIAQFAREQLMLEVCGECSGWREAVVALQQREIDVVILDWSLSDGGAVELIRATRADLPGLRFVILTAREEPEVARAAAEIGVHGFVLKRSGSDALCAALDAALAGKTYFCTNSAPLLASALRDPSTHPLARLSPREIEILRLIASGRSPKETAAALGTSPKTVHNQIASLRTKLDIHETAGLVRYALRHRLISGD